MKKYPISGAYESEPSRSHYFSWINNTNEGSTAAQTIVNLGFFNYMNREYGMKLDIYAWDAGNFDGSRLTYGSLDSPKYLKQYPEGFGPIAKLAEESGTRLGLWGGPDGFGKTKEDAAKRTETMVSFCRDYNFELFKFDGVCGPLRRNKRGYFCNMMKECRRYCPDLILLNHRQNYGSGNKYSTTFLWKGQETYVDVFLNNNVTAMHNRAGIFFRGNVPDFKRLTDDHGTCISSSIDYFEDDLIYQAFGRNLILSPSIYGNPWLMKDSELPRLARIFNLHRANREILVNAMSLEEKYDFGSVSRGSKSKRFIVLGNGTWETRKYTLKLDESIGLGKCDKVRVILHHPYEKLLGDYSYGDKIEIENKPFRAVLVEAADINEASYIMKNKTYEVLHETSGKADKIKEIKHEEDAPIRLGKLRKSGVTDSEALYEATMFALDNDTLEMRSLRRSGDTKIPEVKKARDAFFNQDTYWLRGNDGDILFNPRKGQVYDTKSVYYSNSLRIDGGALRIDFGKTVNAAKAEIEYFEIDKNRYEVKKIKAPQKGTVSEDLRTWHEFTLVGKEIIGAAVQPVIVDSVHNIVEEPGKRKKAVYAFSHTFRYLRLPDCVDRIYSFRLFDEKGREIKVRSPKVNNLQADYSRRQTVEQFALKVHIDEKCTNHFIAIACNGKYGNEGVYCSAEMDGKLIGSPSRAPAYQSNVFEHVVTRAEGNYTYYIPVTKEMLGKDVTLYALYNKKSAGDTVAYLCEKHS